MNLKKLNLTIALTAILILTLTIQITPAYFEGSEESIPKYLESTLPYSYIIDTNSTHYFAYNGTTWKKDYESTNASYVVQQVFDVCSGSNRGGTISWGKGLFHFEYDVKYWNCSMIWQGSGMRYSRYAPTTYIYGTVLWFDDCNLIDYSRPNDDGVWNNGHAEIYARDMVFIFDGGTTADLNGLWKAKTTRPQLDRVVLYLKGQFQSNIDGLFDRGSGASGTVVWKEVYIDDHVSTNSMRMIRVNFDSFIWLGGGIMTQGITTQTNHVMARIEVTIGSFISNIATYRDEIDAPPANAITWFMLTVQNSQHNEVPYEFHQCYFYDWTNGSSVTYHFDCDGAGTVLVDVETCESPLTDNTFKTDGNVAVLKSTTSFSSISNGSYVDIKNRGIKLLGTPQIVIPSVTSNVNVWYSATNSTHVQLFFDSGSTITGSVYCEYKP